MVVDAFGGACHDVVMTALSASSALVDAQLLRTAIELPNVRVFDCTVVLSPDPNGPGTVAASGREGWNEAHIPGSGFLDLLDDLSDPRSDLRFTLPDASRFAAAMGAAGIGDDTTVVLYDRRFTMWAARVWMMLRAFSFRGRAVVLDGGMDAWTQAGGPVSAAPCVYLPASFTAELRPGVFTDRHDVLGGGACVINALSAEQHRGDAGAQHYGRPGHIAGSGNVPWSAVVHPTTGLMRTPGLLS
jgi:thiosulfate/3-mercaptopyruvate sulfurtransferase